MGREMSGGHFRDPGAARAGGYVLAAATVLVAVGLIHEARSPE